MPGRWVPVLAVLLQPSRTYSGLPSNSLTSHLSRKSLSHASPGMEGKKHLAVST